MSQQFDKCCKCKRIVKEDEKHEVKNIKDSKEMGIEISDLVCPHCGGKTFTVSKKNRLTNTK